MSLAEEVLLLLSSPLEEVVEAAALARSAWIGVGSGVA
jgi:hypothetical protein